MAHTRGGAARQHVKNNYGVPTHIKTGQHQWRPGQLQSTSHGRHHVKIQHRLSLLRAYRLGSTCWEHVTVSTSRTLNQNPVGSYLHLIKGIMATDLLVGWNLMLETLQEMESL